jgi:hypothetical protein
MEGHTLNFIVQNWVFESWGCLQGFKWGDGDIDGKDVSTEVTYSMVGDTFLDGQGCQHFICTCNTVLLPETPPVLK